MTERPAPPVAKRKEVTIEQAGRTRTDPYQWLKDENWQKVMADPSVLRSDIREYLEAENAYTKAVLEEPTEGLRETLFRQMRGRIKEDDSSLPSVDGPWAYLVRYREGGEYPIFARKPAADMYNEDAGDTVLLDGDKLGEGKDYFSFGNVDHSPDHRYVAYSYDDQGSEYYDIHVRDTQTGDDLGDVIARTAGDFEWGSDSRTLYWVERDDNGRPVAVHAHRLGETGSREIYREPDPGFFVDVGRSQSGDFIFISAGDHTTSEIRYFPADAETPEPELIAAREPGVEYAVEHWGDDFVINTNADGAVDFKLVTAPVSAPGRDNWRDLVAHSPGTLILGMEALKDHLIRLERKDGLPRVVVRERESGSEHTIAFEGDAYALAISTGYEYDTDRMRLEYASPSTPDETYDYSLVTRERTLRKTREVPSGHDREDYRVERIMAPAHDGESVPVTLLRHKDTPVDGTAPLLLYGYGSYGITIPADFRTSRLSLVDRGFIYAIAHVRGSKARGYQWYLDGKLEKKTNTFRDYLSAGRYLVSQGYGYEGGVVGHGGSAGGLLMGAAANMDPQLFAGIVAAVPFVDVLNTMSDESLPLTPPEWPEWGNPITDPQAYDTILAYSPYDQVRERAYPAMLITGGLSDPRVTYWEPAKWAAKLRHEAPEAGPYFLRINMEAGHGGASGRFEGLKETAIEYAFALAAVGKADGVALD
ncbi:MAG: prolyl oligopeptidase family serine peptidase [Alphaproteobacteria bacterium]|jgi:oligopeptidase B|nr:prolyl oligopeptidase family serine peptidase [Alphaproteobacteria bacterium]